MVAPEVLLRLLGVIGESTLPLLDGSAGRVTAFPGFAFLAAMNLPGDAGKRRLPVPLRSRFSEVAVPDVTDRERAAALMAKHLYGTEAAAVAAVVAVAAATAEALSLAVEVTPAPTPPSGRPPPPPAAAEGTTA